MSKPVSINIKQIEVLYPERGAYSSGGVLRESPTYDIVADISVGENFYQDQRVWDIEALIDMYRRVDSGRRDHINDLRDENKRLTELAEKREADAYSLSAKNEQIRDLKSELYDVSQALKIAGDSNLSLQAEIEKERRSALMNQMQAEMYRMEKENAEKKNDEIVNQLESIVKESDEQ